MRDGFHHSVYKDVDWLSMRRQGTFTAAGGGFQTVPQDFGRLIPNTFINTTTGDQIIGPVDDAEWMKWKYNSVGPSAGRVVLFIDTYWDGIGGSNDILTRTTFRFWPSDTTDGFAYRYITSKGIIGGDGNTYEDFTDSVDNDYIMAPTDIWEAAAHWRMLKNLGIQFQQEYAEYEALAAEYRAQQQGGGGVIQASYGNVDVFHDNLPDTGLGS